jgi:hypothetical protein
MWCIPNKYYPTVTHYLKENILQDGNIHEWRLRGTQVWTIYGENREIVVFTARKFFRYFQHYKLHENDGMIAKYYNDKRQFITCPIYILTNACNKKSEWREKALHYFRTKARSYDIEPGMIFTFYGVPFLIKKYKKNFGFVCKNLGSNKLVIVSTYDIRTKGEFIKKGEM